MTWISDDAIRLFVISLVDCIMFQLVGKERLVG